MIHASCTARFRRRGVMYIHVVFCSVIVAVIATATMRFHRAQGYELRLGRDQQAAKQYANAGIDIALLRMRRYSNWRSLYPNGTWATDQAISKGFYTIKVTDPLDGNLSNRNYDPVRIEVEGKSGSAIYRTSVNANITPAAGSCLDVAMMSGGTMSMASSTITTDQTIASNGSMSSSSSQVYSDAEAGGSATGTTYRRSVTGSVAGRTMPSSATAFDKYNTSADVISATSLPLFTRSEIIASTTFESNMTGWASTASPNTCQISRVNNRERTGNRSLEVKNRTNVNSVAKYTATTGDSRLAKFISGHQYSLTLPLRVDNMAYMKVVCTLTSSGTAMQTFQSSSWFLAFTSTSETGNYNHPNITFRPIFAGAVTQLEVYAIFFSSTTDYNFDDPTLTDITYPDNCRVFERTALTPTLNPYGTSTGTGIYRFDCAGQNVVFGFGRIVGTAVLNNPGSLSGIYAPMDWQPRSHTMPAIMSTDKLNIDMTAWSLNEADIQANLNPTGAPAPYSGGAIDSDMTDSYASLIKGLVYCAGDMSINGTLRLNGVAVANGNISMNGADAVVNYDRTIAEDPPPGFDVGLIDINIAPGTWARVVQ